MGPLARIAAQVAVALTAAVGRAFMVAFMQQRAQMKAGKGAGPAKAATGMMVKDAMNRQQALEILNVEDGASKDEIQQNYEKFFAANDPSKGGSFYLQSKIFRAKEFLDAEGSSESKEESS